MPEFDQQSINRIANAVRKVERMVAPNYPSTAFFQKFAFTILEPPEPGIEFGTAKVQIETLDRVNILIAETELRYKWGILDTKGVGYQGDCTPFGDVFYFDQGLLGNGTNLFHFALTSDLAATYLASATAVSPVGALVVLNPGRFRAFAGAEGMAIEAGQQLFIVHVDQPALRIFTILAAHPNHAYPSNKRFGADPREANAAMNPSVLIPLTPYPFSFVPTQNSLVPNPQHLFGEAGDGAILAWNPATEDYFLEEVFPQRQQESWLKVTTDRPNGLGQDIDCEPLAPASDGSFPNASILVKDLFNVAIHAKAGDQLLARWNADEQKYMAVESQHTARRVNGYVTSDFDNAPAQFDVTVELDIAYLG